MFEPALTLTSPPLFTSTLAPATSTVPEPFTLRMSTLDRDLAGVSRR